MKRVMGRNTVIGGIVAAAAIFHATMTILYLSPPNLVKLATEKVVHAYMAPLFYQDWHLFSPNPGISSTELWVRCKAPREDWTQWLSPFEELQAAHYRNRFTGRGKLLYVYRGIGGRLHERVDELVHECEKNCDEGSIARAARKEREYEVAARFASDYCRGVTKTPLARFELKTVNVTPKKFSERLTSKKWGKVVERSYGGSAR